MRKIIWIGLFSLVFSPSFAATVPTLMNDNNKITIPLYVGAQPGYGKTHYEKSFLLNKPGFTSFSSVDNEGFGARFFGGYDFNQYYAAELGFIYLPKIQYNDINGSGVDAYFRQEVIDVLGKATLPFDHNKFGIFAKGGFAYLHRDELRATANSTDLDSNTADQAYEIAVGGGVSVMPYQHFYMDVSYLRYLPNRDFKTVEFMGVSFAYKFQ